MADVRQLPCSSIMSFKCSFVVSVQFTQMNCLSFLLHSLHQSSPLCWGAENGAHSLSPCVASSLLYLLELSLPSSPSLHSAAAECKVLTVWRQWLWWVTGGYRRAAANPLVVGKIKLLEARKNNPSTEQNIVGSGHVVIRICNRAIALMRKDASLSEND